MPRKKKSLRPVKSFTIRRSRWKRGDDQGGSALLTSSGQMCCLGFYARACGFSKEEILGVGSLSDLADDRYVGKNYDSDLLEGRAEVQELISPVLDREIQLISANDDSQHRGGRETLIRDLFKKSGVRVRFTG